MDAYGILKVIAIAASVGAVFSAISYCIAIWLLSRETHIEPIVIETKQQEKDINSKINEYCNCIAYSVKPRKEKIFDISKEYQNAKVGQVLGGRK